MATTVTWNGSTGSFDASANWSGNVVPGPTNGDVGQIASGTVQISNETLNGFALLLGNPPTTDSPTLALTNATFGPALLIQDTTPINGFNVTNFGTSTNNGTISLAGGGVDNVGDASAPSVFVNGASGTIAVASTQLDLNTTTVRNDGTVTVTSGGGLDIDVASTNTVALVGSGSFVLSGASTLNDAALTTAAGLTVGFADAANDVLAIANAGSFLAAVTGFQGQNEIDLTGVPAADTASWAGNVLTVRNGGTAGAVVATLRVIGNYAAQHFTASIDATGFTRIQLAAADVWNGSTADFGTAADWSLGAAPSAANGYTGQIAAGVVSATGTLDGFGLVLGDPTGANTPVLSLANADFGPNLILQDAAQSIGFGITVTGSLVNDGTIVLAGSTDVATIGGSSAVSFTNAADGRLSVSGALLNIGASSFIENDATIAVSSGGAVGLEFANPGTGTVQGAGAFVLTGGASVDDDAALTTAQTFTFGDATNDTLRISNVAGAAGVAGFHGTVSGFQLNNVIDLTGIAAATGAAWSGGVLTVSNGGTTVASLALSGSYAGTRFLVGTDGTGGTSVQIAPTDVFNGGTGGFDTPTNWSLGVIPGATNGYTAQIVTGTVQIASETIDGIELLIGQPPTTDNPTLALNSATFGPALVLQDTTPIAGFTVTNAGTSVNHGTFNLSGGVDNFNDAAAPSTFVNAADGTINVAGALLDLNTGIVQNDGAIALTAGGGLDIDIANTGTVAFLGTGTVSLAGQSSVVDAAASTASGLTFAFQDATNDVLTIDSTAFNVAGGFSAQITGLQANNQIDLANIVGDTATWAANVLTIRNGGTAGTVVATLNLVGDYGTSSFAVVSDSITGSNVSVACFAAGTRIATTRGEVAVERLREGDAVVTLLGGPTAAVRWVGTRKVDVIAHPNPAQVRPVRVRAGALAAHVPHRDVLLSPEHAVHVDGVLIPVGLLANGTNIVAEDVARVEYFHVELTRHDVLLANGLPAESWLDTGNRSVFANAPVPSLLPAHFVPDTRGAAWAALACAELVTSGARLDAARARIAAAADHQAPRRSA